VQSVVDRSSRTWCSGRTEPQTASSYRIIEASSEPSGTSRKPTEVRHRALASLSESTSEYQVRILTTRGWLIAIRIKRGHRPRPRRSGATTTANVAQRRCRSRRPPRATGHSSSYAIHTNRSSTTRSPSAEPGCVCISRRARWIQSRPPRLVWVAGSSNQGSTSSRLPSSRTLSLRCGPFPVTRTNGRTRR
jgi:hypothetical protein